MALKKLLSLIWFWWKKFGLIVGNLLTDAFLILFYFTIFALFAIPFKILSRPRQDKQSNFVDKEKTVSQLEEFKREF